MAGLWVTVCLPPEAAADVDEGALERALAPFFTDTSDNPPDRGMWDSRRIRDGSDGVGFAVAAGHEHEHEHDPRLLHDDPWYDGTPCPSVFGICAGGPRALLDFSDPLAASRRAAAASWDLWHRLAAVHPPHVPLHDFVERWTNDPDAFPDDRWGDALFAAYGRLGFPAPPNIRSSATTATGRTTSGNAPTPTGGTRTSSPRTAGGARATARPCTPPATPGRVPTTRSEVYLAALPGETVLVRPRCHA
ncbi:hypothetical protein [Streptomyces manipurensis]|uniref:hypothetical protein n=1 Tax=Streptomyces manipurensis TaxID=1077945 RepID=UPI003C6EDC5A